ncbi:MAG: hypothetical protein QW273_02255 [Candidatus Pacearchaeota archaeon]
MKFRIFIILILIPLVNAEIYLHNNLKENYNLGDLIELNTTLTSLKKPDYFIAYEICEDEEDIIYKRFINKEEEKAIFSFILNKIGSCKIKMKYGEYILISSSFDVTDKLKINYTLNTKNLEPSEELIIEGEIRNINDEFITKGEISFFIEGILNKTEIVRDGKFSFKWEVPENLQEGNYLIEIEAKQKDYKNFVKIKEKIRVLSKPKYIKIEGEEISKPPLNYSARITLQDQSNKNITNEKILVRVFNPFNEIYSEGVVISGENYTFF